MTATANASTITEAKKSASRAADINRLKRLAWLLDSSIRVPGTSFRIGLDGLVGLVPGIGDVAAGAASSYILLHAVRLGAPLAVTLRMAINILLESIVGIVPIFGDLFDFVFKANERNVKLLLAYEESPEPVKKRSLLIVVVTIALVIGLSVITVWALIALLGALVAAIQ